MTTSYPLSRWQHAASIAVDGVCVLPYGFYLAAVCAPFIPINMPIATDRLLLITALLYGVLSAPLRLWRMAWYARVCRESTALPTLRLPSRWWRAIAWRWQLWWRRTLALCIGSLPASVLWGYGAVNSADHSGQLIWLLLGGITLVMGISIALVWQSRYCLAPYYLLAGEPADTATALSVRAMRGHRCAYINFIGGELPRLALCLFLLPAVWVVPAFHYRRTALLLSWMQPMQ